MEQLTTEDLARQMATQLKENVPLNTIREWAAMKGATPQQIDLALDEAHTIVQQESNKDPWIRLVLGPALLIIACVAFYTDWAGRSVGPATFIGLITLLIGGRLLWSLIKQWTRRK
jgi:uncharacterized membrane-anchored protein